MLLVSQVFENTLCKPISEGKRKWKPNKQGSHLDIRNFKVSLRLRGIKKRKKEKRASKEW